MPVFDVIVVKKPTKEEDKKGKLEEVLFSARDQVAKDKESIGMSALMDCKAALEAKSYEDADFTTLVKEGRIQVNIRPF